MDCTQICILEQTDHIVLCRFLNSHDGSRLEPQVVLIFSGDFANESLERCASYEKLGRFLELTNLSQGYCAWSEAMGLLYATLSWSVFTGRLMRQAFSRSFSASVLTCSLFGASHLFTLLFSFAFALLLICVTFA